MKKTGHLFQNSLILPQHDNMMVDIKEPAAEKVIVSSRREKLEGTRATSEE